jgi:hypothetical protein
MRSDLAETYANSATSFVLFTTGSKLAVYAHWWPCSDRDDVLQIMRVKGLDLENDEIRKAIDNYGGPDAYHTVKSSLAR